MPMPDGRFDGWPYNYEPPDERPERDFMDEAKAWMEDACEDTDQDQ